MTRLKEGLLWRDDNGTLEERVHRAIAYYQLKYDTTPNRCHVPAKLVEEDFWVDGVCRVVGDSAVNNHDMWIGLAE